MQGVNTRKFNSNNTMDTKTKTKLTFLGTGTSIGVPVIGCDCHVCTSDNPKDKRLRTSAMLEINNKTLIIDCGPDFRMQMIDHHVTDIDALLFTHEHRDHVAGIDDLRAFNYILNKHVEIYATERVIESIKAQFPYIFDCNGYMGAPKLNIHPIENRPFYVDDILIMPIQVMHDTMPVFGFRINDVAYITDANYIADEEKEKLKGCKILVLNALRKSKHKTHFSLEEAVAIIQEIKPDKAFLTHMSHFIGLHNDINNILPQNIQLAYDGLVVEND